MDEEEKIFVRIGRALRIADQLEDRAIELCRDPITAILAISALEFVCVRRLVEQLDQTIYTPDQMNAALRLILAACQLTDSLVHSAQVCEHIDDDIDSFRRQRVRKVLMAVWRGDLESIAGPTDHRDGKEPVEMSIQQILDGMRKES